MAKVELQRHRQKADQFLVGGIIPTSLATIVGSGMKLVPVVGPTIGVMPMPVFAGAATLAIGKIFMQHFESGGTFLDFEPAKVRAYFRQEFEASQERAQEIWARLQSTRPRRASALASANRKRLGRLDVEPHVQPFHLWGDTDVGV